MINSNSKHYDNYYDHILCNEGNKYGSLGKVYEIIHDLSNRQGLQDIFEGIDTDIVDEIIEKWAAILEKKP